MLKINKQTITLTKGDDASLRLVPRYKDRTEYVLTEGDSAVFRIKFGHTLVELDCTLNLETNKIVANITPNDTKDFNPGIYRYEAELITSFGFHYTFIADQTFILGQEYEQRITSTSNGNSSAVGGNLPEIDGIVDGEPVVYGDIQPTNPMMDYDELNHLPKLNDVTIKGSHDNAYYGIPTKTSDLENDSDFVSDNEYVHTDNNYDDTAKNAVDALGTASTYDVPESGNASTSQVVKGDDTRLTDSRNPNPHTHSKADITDFPTNVSAFNNDSGFITNTVNNLANYYLKSETYTRAEVEQLIAAIKQGKFEIVAELPASGDANVIYLVPKSTAQTSNSYDEYVYINNAWEKIGDTDIDLSGYVTDDELTTALQSYLTTSAFNTAIASYYTKTEADNLLGNKVDKVAGKGLSTNDYDNTAKGIVDGVTSALNDKVDKVQGKGLSTNDYDNTAKNIVDGVTSALADKVDKVNGKGLSTEDYTTAEKTKLGAISDEANKVTTSSTNGHINIDGVDATVYDDSAVTNAISAMGDDIEDIQDELSTDSATVEGNPINFSTLSAQTAESTIIDLEPIQDLHGYDKPWVGGAGKNLLPLTVDRIKSINTSVTWVGNVYTANGVALTILTDGDGNVTGIKANGTSTGQIAFNLLISVGYAQNIYKGMKLNGCSGGASTSYCLMLTYSSDGSAWAREDYQRNGEDLTVRTDYDYIRINILIRQNVQVSNVIFYPMIRLSTETDATFEPYANICPITGRTQVGVLGCGKNLFNPSEPTYANTALDVNGNFVPLTNWACYLFKGGKQYAFSYVKPSGYDTVRYGYKVNGVWTRTNSSSIPLIIDATNYEEICFSLDRTSGYELINPQLEIGNQTTQYTAYQSSNNVTIAFGQTVYGGQVDVEKGVLVVDKKILDMSTLSWTTSSQNRWNGGVLSDSKLYPNQEVCDAITEGYVAVSASELYSNLHLIAFAITADKNLMLRNESESEPTGNICYELATPITINLTPNTINLLKGVNNISTDGDSITLTYRDGSVATLEDVKLASEDLEKQIADAQILTDTVTGDKYKLVITNGVLSVEQVSN